MPQPSRERLERGLHAAAAKGDTAAATQLAKAIRAFDAEHAPEGQQRVITHVEGQPDKTMDFPGEMSDDAITDAAVQRMGTASGVPMAGMPQPGQSLMAPMRGGPQPVGPPPAPPSNLGADFIHGAAGASLDMLNLGGEVLGAGARMLPERAQKRLTNYMGNTPGDKIPPAWGEFTERTTAHVDQLYRKGYEGIFGEDPGSLTEPRKTFAGQMGGVTAKTLATLPIAGPKAVAAAIGGAGAGIAAMRGLFPGDEGAAELGELGGVFYSPFAAYKAWSKVDNVAAAFPDAAIGAIEAVPEFMKVLFQYGTSSPVVVKTLIKLLKTTGGGQKIIGAAGKTWASAKELFNYLGVVGVGSTDVSPLLRGDYDE